VAAGVFGFWFLDKVAGEPLPFSWGEDGGGYLGVPRGDFFQVKLEPWEFPSYPHSFTEN
jgi:hypothetical protein